MVFCSTPTFFAIVVIAPSIGYSDKTLHPSIFVWKGILLMLLLFLKYALLAERNVEFSQ